MSPSDKAGEDKQSRAGAPEFLRKTRAAKPKSMSTTKLN